MQCWKCISNHIPCVSILQMPQLKPEGTSMTALNLFTQLCHLARLANTTLSKPLPEEQVCHSVSSQT